jgi:hypothetical protein
MRQIAGPHSRFSLSRPQVKVDLEFGLAKDAGSI